MSSTECWLEISGVASPYHSSLHLPHHCLKLYDHPSRSLLALSHPCISLLSRLLQQLQGLLLSRSSCSLHLRIVSYLYVTSDEDRGRLIRSKLRRSMRIDRASQGTFRSYTVVHLFPQLHRRTQCCLAQSQRLVLRSRVLRDATVCALVLPSPTCSLLYSTHFYRHFCSACHSTCSIRSRSIAASSAPSLPGFSSPFVLLALSISSSWSSLVSIAQHQDRFLCST